MKKGTLILLCGLPGAGKTTLAKKLEADRPAIRLCPDDWIIGILEDINNVPERDRLRNPVEQLLWGHAQRLLEFGNDVIMENGFWSRSERDIYRASAKGMGVQVELHFLDVSFETLWTRVEKRNTEPNEFNLIKQELADDYKSFEVPTDEEMQSYDFSQKYSTD
jgi:predicted kinase